MQSKELKIVFLLSLLYLVLGSKYSHEFGEYLKLANDNDGPVLVRYELAQALAGVVVRTLFEIPFVVFEGLIVFADMIINLFFSEKNVIWWSEVGVWNDAFRNAILMWLPPDYARHLETSLTLTRTIVFSIGLAAFTVGVAYIPLPIVRKNRDLNVSAWIALIGFFVFLSVTTHPYPAEHIM